MKNGSVFFECARCGFRFYRPERNPNDQDDLDEFEDAYRQYLEDHPADRANHRQVLGWMRAHAAALGSEALDIGCGSGKFVRFLRANGADASGVEPSAPLFERYLSKEACFRRTSAEALAAEGKCFTAVTLLDVIEHVESPRAMLRAARDLLAPGGRLFLSTPDVGSVAARAAGPRWHFYNKYHLSYLSPRTLEAVCEREGLRVVSVAHFGKRFPVGYLLRYTRDFLFGGRPQSARKASFLDDVHVPLNLYDVMYACLERR